MPHLRPPQVFQVRDTAPSLAMALVASRQRLGAAGTTAFAAIMNSVVVCVVAVVVVTMVALDFAQHVEPASRNRIGQRSKRWSCRV